ncbi:hypothetical protein B0A50_08534 [Salinomyces thailandicus]|uniref:C2H2-type domain-containing protein n=1 Tax=Salinomyces thailandicus TaxID=706561 RepID=A0A4V5N376_9PEZI|nr:hypothetical protein B0A50_08534 [Salinomyces thailandica]
MQINPYVERAHHEMQAAQMSGAQMAGAQMPMQMMPVQSIPLQHMPQTPVSQGGARTMPNTPQNHAMAWPSPPPTQAKHVRSQSFQLDVAPMPDAMGGNVMMPMPFGQPNTFNFDSASFASDHGYASSAYSSSAVDPLSPQPQHPGHMPTLFEESTSALPGQQISGDFVGSSLMMQATAGAQDFNDPNFDFNNGPMPMSPRQQLLSTLGPEVPASIVDTGVPAWEVQQYIGELSEGDQKYPCMYPKCSRRFGRKENVRAHIQTHLGDRQFRCNLCDKTFVRQHDLKRHVAIHSDDRPFVCACMTGFARHDALTRHRQRGMCVGALPGYEKSEEEKPKRGRPKKERPDMETRVDKASRQRKKNKERAAEAGGDDQESDQQQIVYASSSSGGSDRSFPVTPPDTSDAFDTDAFLNMANGDTQYNNMTSAWRETPPTSPFISSPTKTVDSVDPTNTSNQPFNFDLPLNQHQGISPAMLSARDSPCPANNMPAGSTPDGHRDVFSYGSPSGEPSFHGGSSPTEANDLWDGTLPDHPNVVNGGNSNFNAFSPPGDSHCSSSTYNYSMYHESLDNGGFLGGKNFTSGGGVIMTNGNFDDDMLAMPSSADQERSLSNMLDDWLASH